MKNLLILLLLLVSSAIAAPNLGFNNAEWGDNPQKVSAATGASLTPNGELVQQFPPNVGIAVFTSQSTIAGYPANVDYYFFQNRFFQAVVTFDIPELRNFDFNYNVFISVERYYRAIHDKTITFVNDIYALLQDKYGKKQPVFKGLDPRDTFRYTDRYLSQEVWNLRYHPSEFYRRIVTASYARWDFPKTRVIFSINISAVDKRFDYTLSHVSLDIEKEVNKAVDTLRKQGL